jgi:SAM-dependent methyltransferase
LDTIKDEPIPFERRQQKYFFVIQHLLEQQETMYKKKSHQVEDRIVSIHQPHVRPIVRGKAKAKTEFGAKINISLLDGYARVDHFHWDAFNEGQDLQAQVERFRKLTGKYPELVQVDKIYLTRENRRFLKGDIEEMPFPDNTFDVIVSNCVLNLVPDKNKAFAEMMRVIKPSGHFCVSDVVLKGNLPEELKNDAEMYAGCVSGAIEISEYLNIIELQGFINITVHKQKEILIPEEVLGKYLSVTESIRFKESDTGIFSITVSGYKN